MGKSTASELKKVEPPAQAASYVLNLPQPPARNAEEYLKAFVGYVYTAVGAISQEVASIDLHLYKVKYVGGQPKTQEIFEHEILSVLHYVNQLSTLYEIVEATQIYLELTGEAFWVVLRDATGKPSEFWLLRPDWVKVVPSKTDVIDHYVYHAGGLAADKVDIPKENIIPFKYFNPLNPYRGKGPTQAAAMPFDILNFAQEYNRNFFFNSAIPSLVFSSEQKISEAMIKRFLNQWQSTFGGRSKSNKIAFLGNGMKMDKATTAAKELDFNEQMKNLRDDVLAVYKVPKTVLGLTEDVNKANAQATTAAFMERVITPRMRRFVDSLNEFFVPMFTGDDNSLFLDFTDPAPEDVELKLKRYENGRQNTWLTPNEIRMEENLEPIEGGDDLFATKTAAPTDENADDESGDGSDDNQNDEQDDKPKKPTAEEDDDKKGFFAKWFKRQKKRKIYTPPTYLTAPKPIKHMVKIPVKKPTKLAVEKMAKEFEPIIKEFIGELIKEGNVDMKKGRKKKEDVIVEGSDKAFEALKKDQEKPKGSGWTEEAKSAYWNEFVKKVDKREADIEQTCKDIFKEQEEMVLKKLKDELKSYKKFVGIKASARNVVPSLEELSLMWTTLQNILREIYIDQGNETLEFLGANQNINISTEFASQYLYEYGGEMITGINQTTRDQLMRELSDGFDDGESIDKLADRVQDVFSEANKVRAEAIARTEAIRASNAATVEAYRQSGVVEAKEWLAERDGNTCPFCLQFDGKYIALNANFAKNGETLHAKDEEGNDVKLVVGNGNVGEPPAHTRCRCTTIPVLLSE